MKKLLLIAFVLLMGGVASFAVPAKPGVKRTVTLSDGSKVELTLRGDEHYKFYTGSDGFAYREKKKGFERINLAEARNQWKNIVSRANTAQQSRRRVMGEPSTYIGKKKGLVILMQFQDLSFVTENALDIFKDFFNKENYTDNGMTGSVKDYFKAQSYDNFELDFDVVGPFTADENMAYYGTNDPSLAGTGVLDAHPRTLIYEACLKADSQVNFADYDWDGDGVVEQVFVIYAGYAESQGAAEETIWPHHGYLEGAGYYLTLDDVRINNYECTSELRGNTGAKIDGIGTACHEFSHCLGLPDMYDIEYSGCYGMVSWDVMDYGCYNNYNRTPAGYTSYERMFAGWLAPKEIKGDVQTISNMKALVDEPEAYILYNDADHEEYYLLENRQNQGFDAALPGHGLLILHVDYDLFSWKNNCVNIEPNHQHLTVVAADNDYSQNSLAGDPFPGITGNTSFTNCTTPAATLFRDNTDGEMLLNKAINDITENEDGLISFVAMGEQSPLAIPSPDDGEAVGDENSFTISWPAIDGAVGYQVMLTEKDFELSNVADELKYEFDFNEFVSESETKVNPNNLGAYGLDGWQGDDLYASPNKLYLKGWYSYLLSPEWMMPKSQEITVVVGADQLNKNDFGMLAFGGYDTEDDVDWTFKSFYPTAGNKLVYNFTNTKKYFCIVFYAESYIYLNYLAIYNGRWHKKDLGLEDAAPMNRAANTTVYDTETNSYTFTGLNKENRYHYRVRAVNEDHTYFSAWSDDKVFMFGTTGIQNLLPDAATPHAIYNLQGRNMGTNPSALPKGIYIINGKKVVK